MGPNIKRILVVSSGISCGRSHAMELAIAIAKLEAEHGVKAEIVSPEEAMKEMKFPAPKEYKLSKLPQEEFDTSNLIPYNPTDCTIRSAPIDAITKKGRNGKRKCTFKIVPGCQLPYGY